MRNATHASCVFAALRRISLECFVTGWAGVSVCLGEQPACLEQKLQNSQKPHIGARKRASHLALSSSIVKVAFTRMPHLYLLIRFENKFTVPCPTAAGCLSKGAEELPRINLHGILTTHNFCWCWRALSAAITFLRIVSLCRPPPHQDRGRARAAGNRFARDGKVPGPQLGAKQLITRRAAS